EPQPDDAFARRTAARRAWAEAGADGRHVRRRHPPRAPPIPAGAGTSGHRLRQPADRSAAPGGFALTGCPRAQSERPPVSRRPCHGAIRRGSALTGLVAFLRLVDHIDATLAAHDLTVAMAQLQRAERVP